MCSWRYVESFEMQSTFENDLSFAGRLWRPYGLCRNQAIYGRIKPSYSISMPVEFCIMYTGNFLGRCPTFPAGSKEG